jgi:hypothetical protein
MECFQSCTWQLGQARMDYWGTFHQFFFFIGAMEPCCRGFVSKQQAIIDVQEAVTQV